MDKAHLPSNTFSLFKIFCEKCGNYLKVNSDDPSMSDIVLNLSKNCPHHFCKKCSYNGECPLCKTHIVELEDPEHLSDAERIDCINKLAEKHFMIDGAIYACSQEVCFKKLSPACKGLTKFSSYCRRCFEEKKHGCECLKDSCKDCKLQTDYCFFCQYCYSKHFLIHQEMVIFDEQLSLLIQPCKDSLESLQQNISVLNEGIDELDNFLANQSSLQKQSTNMVQKEYTEIEYKFKMESQQFLDKQKNYVIEKESFLNSCIDKMKLLEYEISMLDQSLDQVAAVHSKKHDITREYSNDLVDDLWNKKYINLNSNVANIKSLLKTFEITKSVIPLAEGALPANLEQKLRNYISVSISNKEFPSERFQNLTVQLPMPVNEEN